MRASSRPLANSILLGRLPAVHCAEKLGSALQNPHSAWPGGIAIDRACVGRKVIEVSLGRASNCGAHDTSYYLACLSAPHLPSIRKAYYTWN